MTLFQKRGALWAAQVAHTDRPTGNSAGTPIEALTMSLWHNIQNITLNLLSVELFIDRLKLTVFCSDLNITVESLSVG